jgi:hypothetical protein
MKLQSHLPLPSHVAVLNRFTMAVLTVDFQDSSDNRHHHFSGKVAQVSFSSDNYVWHPMGANGFADPDGPAVKSTQPGGKGVKYMLPEASVTVLRGVVK